MREILFRGKAKDGEWVEGSLICKYDSDAGCYSTFEIIEKEEYSIALEYDTFFRQLHPILVKEETVGQYTGLTDKNGEKIFEGDIVLAKGSKSSFLRAVIGRVIFENGTFKMEVVAREADTRSDDYRMIADLRMNSLLHSEEQKAFAIENNFIFRGYNLEVIGNIHDHKELLHDSKV